MDRIKDEQVKKALQIGDEGPIEPLPVEQGQEPLAPIAYSTQYAEASDYLRAIMKKQEKSSRALELTAIVLMNNPAHYTVWNYRATVCEAIGRSPKQELDWVESIAFSCQKNFQIWRYRQIMLQRLGDKANVSAELAFLAQMLDADAKNYHVWSHRAWVCRTFDWWEEEREFVERLLDEDVQNNSAWSHRWYLQVDRANVSDLDLSAEFEYAASKIMILPENLSSWNYAKALVGRQANLSNRLSELCDEVLRQDGSCACAVETKARLLGDSKDWAPARQLYQKLQEIDQPRQQYWRHVGDSLPCPSS